MSDLRSGPTESINQQSPNTQIPLASIEIGVPMKGVQHIVRFKKQLHESYEDIEQQLFASHPKLSTSQIQTQLLLAFALDRIAGCPREEITTHITDGQYDEGIDAFYFNRGEKRYTSFSQNSLKLRATIQYQRPTQGRSFGEFIN